MVHAHRKSLKLGWISVGYFLSLCSLPCACISCREETFWIESFVGGFVPLLLHWGSYMATGSGLFMVHVPSVVGHSYGLTHWSLNASLIPGTVSSWICHLTPHHVSCRYPFIFMTIKPVLLHTWSQTPHSLSYASSLLVSPLHLPFLSILFPLLSDIQPSSLKPFFLLSFFGSVDCNIIPAFYGWYLLISEYIPSTFIWD